MQPGESLANDFRFVHTLTPARRDFQCSDPSGPECGMLSADAADTSGTSV